MRSDCIDERERAIELDEFRRLAHISLGRAVLYLREHDAAPFRHTVVQTLIEHGDFTDTLAHECLWDADLDTRKLAQEYLATRG
jgi:hypothetical protein